MQTETKELLVETINQITSSIVSTQEILKELMSMVKILDNRVTLLERDKNELE